MCVAAAVADALRRKLADHARAAGERLNGPAGGDGN